MRIRCVAIALWTLGLSAVSVQAQPGPDGGAVLRVPSLDDPAPRPAARSNATNPAPSSPDSSAAVLDQILANLTVDPRYAVNRDIEPTPTLGPWMICVHSYITKEAPDWARQMTVELRGNPKYRLPAYVFTYGLEERRKEYHRVKELLDKQREFIKDRGLPIMVAPNAKRGEAPLIADNLSFDKMLSLVGTGATGSMESDDLPLQYALSLLKVKHIQVQCAVLVGGYPTQEAAEQALPAIRKLPPPDPNKVQLDKMFYSKTDPNNFKAEGEQVHVNPFKKAFVVRNPAVKADRGPEQPTNDGMDMKLLHKLNADEPLTLLNCKKSVTLAIKQFQTYSTVVETKGPTGGILDKFTGVKTRQGDGVDQAAHDAHNLAGLLRKNQLEAYVLHTKYASIVTVGGFDGLDDPNFRAMQNTLTERLRAVENGIRLENRGAPINMMFFPRPMPMKVPRG